MSVIAEPTEEKPRARRTKRIVLGIVGVLGVAVVGIGVYAWMQYRDLTSAKYTVVAYTVPSAPHLVAGGGETVYRIDPTHSKLTYAVQEKLLGHGTHRAEGSTNGIAGDLAINNDNPNASRVGQIAVNVEQLHSDNNLRDARMRQSNLESHTYPLAYLSVAGVSGLPAHIVEGQSYDFTLKSQLTVKKTPAPVTWTASGSVKDGKLQAHATAQVKMSTFGIGPISVAGFVSTGNDVTLTIDLSALNPSKYSVPDSIEAPDSAPKGKGPSFQKVVMPALAANCASCHQPGEVGAAHWTLATAADAAKVSDGIGSVVGSRYMPPWPASPHGVELLGSKALDQQTVDAFVAWSKAGGQLDVPADTKITPNGGPKVPAPRQDKVLPMPQAYAGSLTLPNDYRCFVLDPHITTPMALTGYQVTPDHRPEIHHVQIFHIDKSQVAAAAKISGADGKPGWSCYGTVSLPSTQRHRHDRNIAGFTGQAGLIAGWVPGQDPVIYPQNSGIKLAPGDALVLQMHYHYNTTPIPDRTTVSLQLDPDSSAIKPIDIINPIGPVEIPCMPGVKAPLCDRNAALADDAQLYGPIGAGAEGGLLAICGHTAEELAATFKNGVASSDCEYQVPEDGTIVSVFGHEHTLGKTFRLTLDPDTAKPTVLLDIPNWNFDWQMNYGLAKPIHVKAGQKVKMECSWDRALDPNRAPKYMVFAEGTEDEMCFATYAMIPDKS
jgi:hypothetical protein